MASSCSERISGGTNPRMPTPHGFVPSFAFVSFRSCSVSALRSSARARKGSAPPSATASANAAVSLTRVIGPCRIGYFVPCDFASGEPSERCRRRGAELLLGPVADRLERFPRQSRLPRPVRQQTRHPARPARRQRRDRSRYAFANCVPPCGEFGIRRQIRRLQDFLLPSRVPGRRGCRAASSRRYDSPSVRPRTTVSLPSSPARRLRAASVSCDSRASKTCESRTTPRAPARETRRSGVRPDPAAHPERELSPRAVGVLPPLLQEDE